MYVAFSFSVLKTHQKGKSEAADMYVQWTKYIHRFVPGLCPFLPSLSPCSLKEVTWSNNYKEYHLGPLYWWYHVIQTCWEVANSLDALATYICFKEWEINTPKTQRLATLVEFLGVQWSRACCIILSKIKVMLLYFVPSITKKEAQYLICFFGFRRSIFHTEILIRLLGDTEGS